MLKTILIYTFVKIRSSKLKNKYVIKNPILRINLENELSD